MIIKVEALGDIYEVKICKQTPLITHLFFANDNVLFFRASIQESETLKHILHFYKKAFKQKINFDKFAIIFSKNSDNQVSSQM